MSDESGVPRPWPEPLHADAASQETHKYSGDSQWTPPDHVLAGASKSERGHMQRYDRTTQQLYKGRQRHNKRINAEDAMYEEHYDRRRSQAYEFTHTPENFQHTATTPPDYPSAYLTYGPELENIGPEIYRETSPELAEHRRSLWLGRQETLYPPQSYGDPHSARTPPDGSYLQSSSSNEQRTGDSSLREQPISRQPSRAVTRGKAIAQFDGIEEPAGPSSPRKAASGRKHRGTHSSNSRGHSRNLGSSQHSGQARQDTQIVPEPQLGIGSPVRERGSSSRQTRSRRSARHDDDGCCDVM